jgi:alpha-galactosidase
MKFTALDENAIYKVVDEDKEYTGAELMYIGLEVDMWGDYTSKTWRLKKKS